MELFSYSSSSSPSSPPSTFLSLHRQEEKKGKRPLHAVRKLPAKPWKKPAIAPLPPTPPKVYKVDSVNFREVVQKLTNAPQFQTHRVLHDLAPPPLDLSNASHAPLEDLLPSPPKLPVSPTFQDLMTQTLDTKPTNVSDTGSAGLSSLGFSLSPLSHAWCSFPLLSPGTLSSMEQSTVL